MCPFGVFRLALVCVVLLCTDLCYDVVVCVVLCVIVCVWLFCF